MVSSKIKRFLPCLLAVLLLLAVSCGPNIANPPQETPGGNGHAVTEQLPAPQTSGENTSEDKDDRHPGNNDPLNSSLNVDPVVNYLKKDFSEIKQILGEPDREGYSEFMGEVNYMYYEKQDICFYSPFHGVPNLGNEVVTLMELGIGNEFLNVAVGMTFAEIEGVLGPPDYGPGESELEEGYFIGYEFEEKAEQHSEPEIGITFRAQSLQEPTFEAMIKWNYH